MGAAAARLLGRMLAFLRRSLARTMGSPLPLRLLPSLPPLPSELSQLPGWRQRRRTLQLWALAGLLLVLRPLWPIRLLPGWLLGAVLLWAVVELLLCCWRPRRWS